MQNNFRSYQSISTVTFVFKENFEQKNCYLSPCVGLLINKLKWPGFFANDFNKVFFFETQVKSLLDFKSTTNGGIDVETHARLSEKFAM